MRLHRAALGMYPDETCFDTTRPSWLPYWIDDFQETACKANLLISGNTTGNTAPASSGSADPATIANTQAACVTNGGTWDPTNNICTPGLLQQLSPIAIAGAVGLVAILILVKK